MLGGMDGSAERSTARLSDSTELIAGSPKAELVPILFVRA